MQKTFLLLNYKCYGVLKGGAPKWGVKFTNNPKIIIKGDNKIIVFCVSQLVRILVNIKRRKYSSP